MTPTLQWIELYQFRMWCCKILPTIFDDTMSLYQTVCKAIELLNNTMNNVDYLKVDLDTFKQEVNKQFTELKNGTWIEGTIPYLEKLLKEYIPVGIFFGINDDGYFTATIPDSWDNIFFNTTGYDINLAIQPEYGHLVLSY